MFEQALTFLDLKLPDAWMILVGMAVFWAYYKTASRVLFKPLLKLAEERELRTEGAQAGAVEAQQEAARLDAIYEETIFEARKEAVAKRLEKLSVAGKEASRVVAAAEGIAKQESSEGRIELSKMESSLKSQLTGSVDSLAQQLSEKIMSSQV